eukprot:4951660-Karenia_brevis.AAC.1
MAVLKLIMPGEGLTSRISSSNGATLRLCPPFSHAAMAALKLIMLGNVFSLNISLSDCATHSHCPHSKHSRP